MMSAAVFLSQCPHCWSKLGPDGYENFVTSSDADFKQPKALLKGDSADFSKFKSQFKIQYLKCQQSHREWFGVKCYVLERLTVSLYNCLLCC